MNGFKNLKVGTKIIAGYLIALALMVVVGGVAMVRLSEVGTTVADLTDNLAVDRQIGNDMVADILLTRFYANKYITSQTASDLDRYREESGKLQALIIQAAQDITQAERAALLETTYGIEFGTMVDGLRSANPPPEGDASALVPLPSTA